MGLVVSQKAIKLAISGKGGVGKTTVAALLIRHLAKDGRRVLAVDADPVASLGGALGFPDHMSIVPLSEMKDFIFERTGAKPGTLGGFFKMNPRVDDIPERFAKVHDNVHLMVMGTVDSGGSGCVCPESILLKNLVQHLLLYQDEALVLDMEAGVEHLGRATAGAVDLMLTVVEPGSRSINAAKMVRKLAADIGLERVAAVANKVRSADDELAIAKALGDMPLLGSVPFDPAFVEADLAGKLVFQNGIPAQLSKVMRGIIAAATAE
ncbi:MAG TPA: carbon monoxide dehydrogenase accessory protein CooC [Myxococcota bacterium]|nr:carbon monoxide dehydrogenase accessory protein CooC [Myxococcota bacterium]